MPISCCLVGCPSGSSALIGAEDARVSLRINPAEDFDAVSPATGAPEVRWDARTGGASFHRACWESLR